MGLTNWQLFFQDLQNSTQTQPVQDNEVLTVVRHTSDVSLLADAGDSVYDQELLAIGGLLGYWRLTDDEAYYQAVKLRAPSAFYRLDDLSGTTAVDASGNARNGTYSGGFTLNQNGPLSDGSRSSFFDGVNGKVIAPNASFPISGNVPFTIETWINPPTRPVADDVFIGRNENVTGNRNGCFMFMHRTSMGDWIVVERWAHNVGWTISGTPGNLVFGSWHYVVATYDGATLRLYINAVLIGAVAAPGAVDTLIGQVGVAGAGEVVGLPAKVYQKDTAFYPVALSATDIAHTYALRTSTIVSTSSLSVIDASGNGHSADVTGGVFLKQTGLNPDLSKVAQLDGSHGSGITLSSQTPIPTVFTIAAIVTRTGKGADAFEYIWGSGSALSFPIEFAFEDIGAGAMRLAFFLSYTTLAPGWQNTGFVPALNTQYHCVLTWDGTTVVVYVNGNSVFSSTTWSGRTILNAGSTSGVRSIGWQGPGNHEGLNGYISRVSIHNFAMNSTQVTALANAAAATLNFARVGASESRVDTARVGVSEVV